MATAYDQLHFSSNTHRGRHPARIAAIAQLFGFRSAPPAGARVLELGCGIGWNLIAIAESLPGSYCRGLDLSAPQIEIARADAAEAGITNAEFTQGPFEAIDDSWGEFDYILCHGVYSWVPEESRQAILSILAERLAPRGIACVSYNTLPGWHYRRILKDLLKSKDDPSQDPRARVRAARELIETFSKGLGYDRFYSLQLQQELDRVRRESDSYIFHDFLEGDNHAFYFRDFVRQIGERDLLYLGDARFGKILHRRVNDADIPPEAQAGFMLPDRVEREQLMDFVFGTVHRETLVCRAGIDFSCDADPAAIQDMHLAACWRPALPDSSFRDDEEIELVNPRGMPLMVSGRWRKLALGDLADAWPEYVPYSRLIKSLRASLGRSDQAEKDLTSFLLQLFGRDSLEIDLYPPPAGKEPAARPLTSRFARLQAERGSKVTNLCHETVELGALEIEMLKMLDGETGPEGLLKKLKPLFEDGRMTIAEEGVPISDPAEREANLAVLIEDGLKTLGQAGLLIKPEEEKSWLKSLAGKVFKP